jgi:hypothetical protein
VAPLKPLTHQEALEALRAFLKERSSYDVFPVSFRLIVLDSHLKVKKALDVMLLYGELSTVQVRIKLIPRCGICSSVEHGPSDLCRHVHCARRHPPHSILLPHVQLGRRGRRCGAVPSTELER